MKKNYLRIIFITLAILMLSIGIALLSVTALDGDDSFTTGENEMIWTPDSFDSSAIEDELPSMGEINIGGGATVTPQDFTVVTGEISDGVYALRNVGNGQLWMGIERNYVTPGYHMQQYAFGYSPADEFTQAGLFKISKKPGTNSYIIRSMLNNRLSFGFVGTEVLTKIIPANDADVDNLDTFTLINSSSGCLIYPNNPSNNRTYAVSAKNTTASGASGAPNSYLAKRDKNEAGTRAKWELQKYEGVNHSATYKTITPDSTTGVVVGQKYVISTYGWTTLIGVNEVAMEVPAAYADMASIVWNEEDECYNLIANKAGYFRINSLIKNASGATVATYYSTHRAVPPIEDGVSYYLQNVGTKRYMDVEGPSTAEGAIIQQWSFSTAPQKKWIFTRESGGYFTIKSAYSNKYVGVDSSNTSVIRQYGTKSDYTLWYFESTASGNYSLHCKASAVTGALALPSVSSGDGANLRIYTYTDDTNYRDEWRLIAYIAYVNNYYDSGYFVRYYETETVASNKIDNYSNTISEQYIRLFGLLIVPSTSQYYESPIDICKKTVTNSNINTLCSHDGIIHTNRDSVLASFNGTHTGNNVTTSVLWSCHRIVSIAANGKPEYNRSCSWGTGVFMLEISNVNRDRDSAGILMHELNHQYGAKDHYHELEDENDEESCIFKSICSECGDNPRPASCIMNQSRTDISVDTIICSSCKNDILAHLNSHHKN